MKKLITSIFVCVLFVGLIGSSSDSNPSMPHTNSSPVKKLSRLISEKKTGSEFPEINLFNFKSTAGENDNTSSFVSEASVLKIKPGALKEILKTRNENITFNIPLSGNSSMELELTQSFPCSDDFTLIEKNGVQDKIVEYTPGLHYSGIIKGKENSIASVSIFRDFVMGIISDETGNYVLGSIKNSDNTYSDNYIFYNDKDMLVQNKFKCGVDEYESKLIKSIPEIGNSPDNVLNDNPARQPVKVYFEADNKLYQDQNNNGQNVVNFITGFFNSVKTIYQNEAIPFEISSIGVWTAADPYQNINDSYIALKKFGGNTKDNFQGNIAHFLTTRNAGLGGIAWIRVLCSQYNTNDSSGRYAFSNIDNNYVNYPTFSWTVQVVTHEMGHSLGSRHTHACNWPIGGGIRAIDSCYNAEGGCFTQTRARIGTIMSYCHLWTTQQGGGINLASGFGPLPGDTIRLRYSQAHCLDQALNSSEQPSTFDLKQNFPNPFNPNTIIRFALPVESNVNIKVYDVNGKLIADLINNKLYLPGFYDVSFDASKYNLSSGIYFYKIVTDNFTETKRMVLLK